MILEILLSDFQNNCNYIRTNTQIHERDELILVAGIWGTGFPRSSSVTLFLKIPTINLHPSHIATISIK